MMTTLEIQDIIESFDKISDGVYIQNRTILDNSICKYTSFSNLLEMLNGSFTISNRTAFSDRCERGEYSNERFKFFHFFPVVEGLKPSATDWERWEKEDKQLELSQYVYASSWSHKDYEDYLMWRAYATRGLGVRINTTVKDFLSALKLENCILLCSKIQYRNAPKQTTFDRLFLKDVEYESETEIRFCIIPENIDVTKKRVSIGVDPQFIKSITLSPFESQFILNMCKEAILKLNPNVQVNKSKILYEKM